MTTMMHSGWGRIVAATVGAALLGTAVPVVAGEGLPPLRVDPALLGGVPLKPRPATAPAAVPAPPLAAPVAAPDVAPAEPVALPPESPQGVAQAQAVPLPPVARELPATDPVPVPAPAAATALPDTVAAGAPVATQRVPAEATQAQRPAPAREVAAASTSSAGNLPSLRVDPVLLGIPATARQIPAAPVATDTAPPAVAERPALPPLYSAHVAAGALPHPATTPFSHVRKEDAPTEIFAHRIEGINEVEAVAAGDAMLRRGGDSLHADRITYRQAEDEIEAIGNVRLAAPDILITGPRLRMRLEESTGEFESPAYVIRHVPDPVPEPALTMSGLPAISTGGKVLATTGRMLQPPTVTGSGEADRIELRGENQYRLSNATYSTCAPGQRDWEVRVASLDLDYDTAVGTARNASVHFKGMPVMYAPWMSFALGNQRKSGFLTPTIGSTSKGGFEATVPWYWNIAPNMDATITPRVMSRRGVQLNTEFRYLDYRYGGLVRAEYLPGDRQAKHDRYGYSIFHTHQPGHGLGFSLNVNRVSDDDYYSDLSTRIASVSQGNLLRQGVLTYGGSWYSAALNVQSYQTLQDLAKPYQRLPQLTVNANRHDLPLGLAFGFSGEYVNFDHPTDVLAKRTVLYPQLSLPLATPAFWVTPKLGVHHTQYRFERQGAGVPATQSRSVPILSVDGGFVMERSTEMFGQSLVQTLEPRAYYLYVPPRDRIRLPNRGFDTALVGFNYANMFRENRYAGNDRIGDASDLTLALTTRFLDPAGGSELLRATLGTRYYFRDEKVVLPGDTPRTERKADILGAFTGRVLPDIYADLGWQYNPRDNRTEQLTAGARYRPSPDKLLNTAYRFTRDSGSGSRNRQIDVSGQWRLFGGWHGVGRYNYSISERRVVEAIGGLEYNAGCWVGRFVVQRLATIAEKPTTAIFLQLELNDFSRIGSNPLNLLKRNIPGYGIINQPTADPVFAAD